MTIATTVWGDVAAAANDNGNDQSNRPFAHPQTNHRPADRVACKISVWGGTGWLNSASVPRYEKEFSNVQDVFELQRNLNNAFAYDLVPSPPVIVAALRAARRVNDFPTAVRIFEGTISLEDPGLCANAIHHPGIRAKVENKQQYEQYLEELAPLRRELGVELLEDLYPDLAK